MKKKKHDLKRAFFLTLVHTKISIFTKFTDRFYIFQTQFKITSGIPKCKLHPNDTNCFYSIKTETLWCTVFGEHWDSHHFSVVCNWRPPFFHLFLQFLLGKLGLQRFLLPLHSNHKIRSLFSILCLI